MVEPTNTVPVKAINNKPIELTNQRIYYIKDNKRHIYPYYDTFTTHCKQRWYNQSLIHILSTEFAINNTAYYRHAIATGKIRVNNESVPEDTTLQHNDVITHTAHIHEPCIPATVPTYRIHTVQQCINNTTVEHTLYCINKPAGICVYPIGNNHRNTLHSLLRYKYNIPNPEQTLHYCYRLDRVTSGLIIATLSAQTKTYITDLIQSHQIRKIYIARVHGKLNTTESFTVNEPIARISAKYAYSVVSNNTVNTPYNNIAKQCTTIFMLLSYDAVSNTSLVQCEPITGRTHQIRVHLQFIGHSIVNDTKYGGINGFIYQSNGNHNDNVIDFNVDEQYNADYMSQCYDSDCIDCTTPSHFNNSITDTTDIIDIAEQQWSASKNCNEIYLHAYKYCSAEIGELSVTLPYWAV